MYKEMQKYEITTPALFWDIASIKDTEEGAIITYSDTKIGIVVKIERDTITGKGSDFKETHYDAISEFYRAVLTDRYSFIQMNVMEQAGKDPRLNELSKLINKSDNPNVCKLMELEIGHIKNITNTTLYESDYFLFYTHDASKIDVIIEEIYESLFKLLDGAYIGFSILSHKEIVDLVKDLYGVNYFNSTQASLMMFDGGVAMNPITISNLVWTDGNNQKLTNVEINKLRRMTSEIIRETVKQDDVSLKKALYKENREDKLGISFEELTGINSENNSKRTVMIQKDKQYEKQRQEKLQQQQKQQQQTINNQQNIEQEKLNSNQATAKRTLPSDDDDEIIDI